MCDGLVYVEIQKGMYSLLQAGLLAQELPAQRLATHGYTQSKLTPGLWTHKTRPIQFCLVTDDYGVKYIRKEHAEYAKGILEQHYKLSTDWVGAKYVRLMIKCDYNMREVHL